MFDNMKIADSPMEIAIAVLAPVLAVVVINLLGTFIYKQSTKDKSVEEAKRRRARFIVRLLSIAGGLIAFALVSLPQFGVYVIR